MTTREAGKAGEHVATATLIEAVRTDGVEWEDHRGRVVMLAEDYDALRAAAVAVLDKVISSADAQMARKYIVMHELVAAVELARALRERLR